MSLVCRCFAVLLVYGLLLSGVQVFVSAQNDGHYMVLLFDQPGTYLLDTGEEQLKDMSSVYGVSEDWYGVLSPDNNHVLYLYPDNLAEGIFLVNLDDSEQTRLMLDSSDGFDFARWYWLLGGRYAVIQAGVMVETANPDYQIPRVEALWLVDIERKQVEPWLWDCYQLVQIDSVVEFGVHCVPANFVDVEIDDVVVLSDGWQSADELSYSQIDGTLKAPLAFSPDMRRVVFATRDASSWLLGDVWLYDLGTASSMRFGSIPYSSSLRFEWSASGRYIAGWKYGLNPLLLWSDTGNLVWSSDWADVSRAEPAQWTDVTWVGDESTFLASYYATNYGEGDPLISEVVEVSIDDYSVRRWSLPWDLAPSDIRIMEY